MRFKITYRPETGREPEFLEAERVTVEGACHVLRQTVLVIGRPREVAVRRVSSEEVLSIDVGSPAPPAGRQGMLNLGEPL